MQVEFFALRDTQLGEARLKAGDPAGKLEITVNGLDPRAFIRAAQQGGLVTQRPEAKPEPTPAAKPK